MLQQQVFEPGTLAQQLGQDAVAEQVGNLEEMPDRVQALQRQVVGVVAALARRSGPADEGRAETLTHLLLLNVEHLLGHLFPGETQVAFGGHEPQAHAATRGQQQGTRVIVSAGPLKQGLGGPMRQVAGGEEVGQCVAGQAS